MKNVVIIHASERKGGNSDQMADAFERGVREAGNKVENIWIKDLKFGPCKGCYSCEHMGRCVQDDDMAQVLDCLKEADAIAFATPIYFYEMAGQMKVLLDRTMPLYFRENGFHEIYLLTSSESGDRHAMDGTITGLKGWIRCFEGVELAGVAFGGGTLKPKDIQKHPEELQEAYKLGKSV